MVIIPLRRLGCEFALQGHRGRLRTWVGKARLASLCLSLRSLRPPVPVLPCRRTDQRGGDGRRRPNRPRQRIAPPIDRPKLGGTPRSRPLFESADVRHLSIQLGFEPAAGAGRSPDTVSDVIQDAAQRPSGRRRSSMVDNSAGRATAEVHDLSAACRSCRISFRKWRCDTSKTSRRSCPKASRFRCRAATPAHNWGTGQPPLWRIAGGCP